MYALNIPSPEFVDAVIQSGKAANCEGIILLFIRGLTQNNIQELLRDWDDLDDITHNDILVLSVGISIKDQGVFTDRNCEVKAKDISIKYPKVGLFSKIFTGNDVIAHHIQKNRREGAGNILVDTHGTTDIRRALKIDEDQLPLLLIIPYRTSTRFLIELGDNKGQISPVKFIKKLMSNLEDKPYRYRENSKKINELSEKISNLNSRIKGLQIKIDRSEQRNQLETIILYIYETTENAPKDIRIAGQTIVDFLNGTIEDLDPNEVSTIESCLINYAKTKPSSVSPRFAKKLKNAISKKIAQVPLEENANKNKIILLENTKQELISTVNELEQEQTEIDINGIFRNATKQTIEYFNMVERSTEEDEQFYIVAPKEKITQRQKVFAYRVALILISYFSFLLILYKYNLLNEWKENIALISFIITILTIAMGIWGAKPSK